MTAKKENKGLAGDNLKQLRKEAHLSQEKLAEEFQRYDGCINCSGQNISNWEKGIPPSQKYVNAYLDYFGCTMDFLRGYSEFPNETLEDTRRRKAKGKMDATINTKFELKRIAKRFLSEWLSLNGYAYVRTVMKSQPGSDSEHFKVFPGVVESNAQYRLVFHIYSKDPRSEESKSFHTAPGEIMVTGKDLHLFPRELLQYTEMRLKSITAYNDYTPYELFSFDDEGNEIT